MDTSDETLDTNRSTSRASLASLIFVIVTFSFLLNSIVGARVEADQAEAQKAPLAGLAARKREAQTRVEDELGVAAQSMAIAAKQVDRAEWNGLVSSFEKAYGLQVYLSETGAKNTLPAPDMLRAQRSMETDNGKVYAEVVAPPLSSPVFQIEGTRPGFIIAMSALAVGLATLALAYPMRMRLPIALAFGALAASFACMLVRDVAISRDTSAIAAIDQAVNSLADLRVSQMGTSWAIFEAGLPAWTDGCGDSTFKLLVSTTERSDMSAVLIMGGDGQVKHETGGYDGWLSQAPLPSSAGKALKTGVISKSPAACGFIGLLCESVSVPMPEGGVFVAFLPMPAPDFHGLGHQAPEYPWKGAALLCLAIGAAFSIAAWAAIATRRIGL